MASGVFLTKTNISLSFMYHMLF